MDLFNQLSLQDGVGNGDHALFGMSNLTLSEVSDDVSVMDVDDEGESVVGVESVQSFEEVLGGTNLGQELDEEETDKGSNSNVIKNLLSPTRLGIAAATARNGTESENPRDGDTFEEQESPKADTVTDSRDYMTEIKSELRNRSGKEPINIMINYHNYYNNGSTADVGVVSTSSRRVPSMHDQYYNNIHSNDLSHGKEPSNLRLPSPWSIYAHPVSKLSYKVITLSQIFLNFVTLIITLSLMILTLYTIIKDIRSIWQLKKEELIIESLSCKQNFTINRCNNNDRRLPALYKECEKWYHCMNRNNDNFFTARTTLTMSFFGQVLNSFIEPIGFKAILMIISSLFIWVYSSNFLFGFARAKSYYGPSSQHNFPSTPKEPLQNNLLQAQESNNTGLNQSSNNETALTTIVK